MRLKQFLGEGRKVNAPQASEVSLLKGRLAEWLKKRGWKTKVIDSEIVATFPSTPEGALAEMTQAIGFIELHEMTFCSGQRTGSVPMWEVRGDRLTYFCTIILMVDSKRPAGQIHFYEG